jgi:hypothetical protein
MACLYELCLEECIKLSLKAEFYKNRSFLLSGLAHQHQASDALQEECVRDAKHFLPTNKGLSAESLKLACLSATGMYPLLNNFNQNVLGKKYDQVHD